MMFQPKHILMFAPTSTLGIDKRIQQSALSLANAGHKVTILADPPSIESFYFKHENITVDYLEHYSRENGYYKLLKMKQVAEKTTFAARLLNKLIFGRGIICKKIHKRLCYKDRIYGVLLLRQLGFRLYFKYRRLFHIHLSNRWQFVRAILLNKEKPIDVLFSHDLWSLPAALLVKEFVDVPLIYDTHEISTTVLAHKAIIPFVEKHQHKWYKKADVFLTVNQSVAKYYERISPGLKLKVIINGPEYDRSPKLSPKRKQESIFKFVFIGGIYDESILSHVIKALSLMDSRFHLRIIGEGKGLEDVKSLVQKLDLTKRVEFFSTVPYEQLWELLEPCDAGVVPRIQNYFNLGMNSSSKCYDYIHAGLPVISDIGVEMDRLMNNYCIGYTIDFNQEPQILAKKLEDMEKFIEQQGLPTKFKQAQAELVWPENYDKIVLDGLIEEVGAF